MTTRLIALDPGFGGFKTAEVNGNGVTVQVIPSVVGIGGTDHGLLGTGLTRRSRKKPLTVSFEGVSYLAGANVHQYARPVERLDFLRLSEGPELRALIYAALWSIIDGGHHELKLMVGLPVEVLQDRPLALATLNTLRSWLVGDHKFNVSGEAAEAVIRQVKAIAQPVGTYFNWGMDGNGQWIQDTAILKAPVAIMDIGFNTLDLFAVERGQVVNRFTGGDTLGMRRAAETLSRNVRANYGVQLSLHQADDYLRQYAKSRPITLYHADGEANIRELVRQAVTNAAAAITNFAERSWGNGRQFRYLLITGGGAEALHKDLLRQFPHAQIMPDPVTANALGLAKYARKQGVF